MRWLAAIATLLAGCAVLVPDYHANRHIWTPPPPHVHVQLVPQGNVCASERDGDGKQYVPALVLIHVVELPPLQALVDIDQGEEVVVMSANRSFAVRWRAGLGLHRVDTDVGGHKATRVLTVWPCRRTRRGEVPIP